MNGKKIPVNQNFQKFPCRARHQLFLFKTGRDANSTSTQGMTQRNVNELQMGFWYERCQDIFL